MNAYLEVYDKVLELPKMGFQNDVLIFDRQTFRKIPYSRIRKSCEYVYFLFNKEDVVYVGFSRKFINRINSHLNQGRKKFDTIMAIAFPSGYNQSAMSIESSCIEIFNPIYNIAGTSRDKRTHKKTP